MQSLLRRFSAVALAVAAVGAFVAFGALPSGATVAQQHLIVTGPGPGGGPHVAIFKANDAKVQINFFAYDPSFSGGVGSPGTELEFAL